MKILDIKNLTKRNALAALTAGDVVELKKVDNRTELDVKGYVIQEIVNNETGEVFESMVILTTDGLFATRSESFMSSLIELYETFGDEVLNDDGTLSIVVYKVMSKNNREFISCGLRGDLHEIYYKNRYDYDSKCDIV